ncbi:SDR family oxidoreductase [Verticiella sediminum]|uniref:SDR family oxidoreductase n=1 Tax=Verticiella sediminum TaxID=1247510 RepID=A0A556AIP2_9BURK|nr:SDR family oxidoreductase [Verticiella sediminum]TSH92774.1 SDR family oxidoreductase [Verticiella sediminum]
METVLITGAASGIGRAAAWCFATHGWRCLLLDRNAAALHALVEALPAAATATAPHMALPVDLTRGAEVRIMAAGLPALDAVINNAGMSDTSGLPIVGHGDAQWQRLVAINLEAPARIVRAVAPRLSPGARIVNVSSGAGLHAIPFRGAYSPTKAGLIAQTQALARARPDLGVTVLCPGFVRTELVQSLIAAGRLDPARAVAKIPLGRMAQPEEMAQAMRFLASRDARVLSGQVVSVDGGSSVFGGSATVAPVDAAPVALEAPSSLRVVGEGAQIWSGIAVNPAGAAYPGVLDVSPLACADSLQAVRAAAMRFASEHREQASLTLLLPPAREASWEDAGLAAAARMLVATLACELGGRALRVNAVEVAPGQSPEALAPWLRFLAGAGAQYLTGQVFRPNARPEANGKLQEERQDDQT